MSWSIGYDANRKRDIGYGVPAICEHPDCSKKIDRGLAYCCGGEHGSERGCGLYFCEDHLYVPGPRRPQLCDRCCHYRKPFPQKPDDPMWTKFKLTDKSWKAWRKENGHPEPTAAMRKEIREYERSL